MTPCRRLMQRLCDFHLQYIMLHVTGSRGIVRRPTMPGFEHLIITYQGLPGGGASSRFHRSAPRSLACPLTTSYMLTGATDTRISISHHSSTIAIELHRDIPPSGRYRSMREPMMLKRNRGLRELPAGCGRGGVEDEPIYMLRFQERVDAWIEDQLRITMARFEDEMELRHQHL